MENESRFQEKLHKLLERAEENGNRLSGDEVKSVMAEEHLTEDQMQMVFDFLLMKKITLTGYYYAEHQSDPAEAEEFTEEEKRYLEHYRSDLEAMEPEKTGERERLFQAASEEDPEARRRLTELYLPVVLDIAKALHEPGVHIGDMVQEGNLSLILAVEMITDSADADVFIRREIRRGILSVVDEQKDTERKGNQIADRANELNDLLHEMAEEEGRAVTMQEVAERMQISVEEVLDIVKLAGEDLYDKYKDDGK